MLGAASVPRSVAGDSGLHSPFPIAETRHPRGIVPGAGSAAEPGGMLVVRISIAHRQKPYHHSYLQVLHLQLPGKLSW